MRAGKALSPDDPYGVVAGLGLSQRIDATPGAALTLAANSEKGALNATNATLRGVFEGGLKEYDDWTLKVPLRAAQELLLGIWEVGRITEVQQMLHNAAREGGRQASTGQPDATGVTNVVKNYVKRNGYTNTNVSVVVKNHSSNPFARA